MTHANVLALGPELRLWARELTDDLNEAYYLTHEVVRRVTSDGDERPLDVETARDILHQVAREVRTRPQIAA